MKADPTAAGAEWLAEFRGDLSAFLSDELIEKAIDFARPIELSPMTNTHYKAFVDPSGGTGADSYCLAIAHMAGKNFVLDLCYGTPPGQTFDPDEVTKRYAPSWGTSPRSDRCVRDGRGWSPGNSQGLPRATSEVDGAHPSPVSAIGGECRRA
jgi:hypothetical protein